MTTHIKSNLFKSLPTLLLFSLVGMESAYARPEYALKHGLPQCTACHVSPFGGGIRNVDGKYYGHHGLNQSALPVQEMFALDLRAIAIYPNEPAKKGNGVALMAAIPYANLPITKNEAGLTNSRAVLGYGLGGFATGLREAYVLFDTAPAENQGYLKHILVGNFNLPFGLQTDEHRTFVRQVSATTLNKYEFGLGIAGEPLSILHYDFTFTNGFQTAGAPNSTDLPYALSGNLRLTPGRLPFFLGLSGMIHRKIQLPYNPYAAAVYTGISFDRLTRGRLKGSLSGEAMAARGWSNTVLNSYISSYIPASQSVWQNAVAQAKSLAFLIQASVDLSPRFSLRYKFDEYVPARPFVGDAFIRHSFGFRYFVNSNMQLMVMREESKAKRAGISDLESSVARSGFIALLEAGI